MIVVLPVLAQSRHRLRFDWAGQGAAAVAHGADVAVVVDVLSFTTALSVAADRGVVVLPYPLDADGAAAHAAERDALLAVPRADAGPGDVSLSPASLRRCDGAPRVVLPSPNGSAVSFALRGGGCTVVGACLRNADAVARWVAAHHGTGARVAVVAAGERWPDGSLRPCVEDLWGAGAVLAALADHGLSAPSPEARVAVAAWREVEGREHEALAACASGAELADAGYAVDVEVAAEAGQGHAVPVLDDDAFVPVTPRRAH